MENIFFCEISLQERFKNIEMFTIKLIVNTRYSIYIYR